ncbi:hypothetical protein GCM10010240_62130 [Streptomyces griseoviridis]|nr:hypothetical protein GCM10010240_62130 [Streptomyces griseoviridis]
MADQGERLARAQGGLDEPDGVGVLGEVPERAVAAGVEDRVEVVGGDAVEADGVGEGGHGLLVGLEAAGLLGLEAGFVALGVQRGTAALGGGQGDVPAGLLEAVVGSGQFLQPEAGLPAGVAEPVVRGEDDEDLHGGVLPVSQ